MSISDAFEAILHSPRLPEYAAIIQQRLAEETARRQKFYSEMSDDQKMEFIDGEVIVHSPSRNWHLNASKHLLKLLDTWVSQNHLGLVQCEKALCIFQRNDYEPDIVFWGLEKSAAIKPDTLKFPVPDFVVEILSDSTASRDHGVKFEDYAAHHVREYWIINPEYESVEAYRLNDAGEYILSPPDANSMLSSSVIRGFTIPIRAIFDAAINRQTLATMLGKLNS